MRLQPGSGTLPQEIVNLRKQIAEVTRGRLHIPVCRVNLTGTPTLAAGDTMAQGGWAVREDPDNLFKPGGTSNVTYAHITVPVSGFYAIQFHANQVGPTSGFGEAKVLRNGTSITANTVACGQAFYASGMGGGAQIDAIRVRIALTQNDTLYWSNYTSATCTLTPTAFGNVRTEIALVYTGP